MIRTRDGHMPSDDDIRIFVDLESAERGWSANTREAYRRDVLLYFEYLNSLGKRCISETNADLVLTFLDVRKEAGDAERTLNRRLAALRTFHRHLLSEGKLSRDIVPHLPSPRRTQDLPHFLSTVEVEHLLRICEESGKTARRDRSIVELLYATGVRASELVRLERSDFLREGDRIASVKVLGKGGKERLIPVHDSAATTLDDYLRRERPRLERPHSPRQVYLTRRGTAMSRIQLYSTLRRLGLAAGIRQRVTPHLLRHTFATHLVHGGADLRAVQEMLGHANLATTTIYTSVDTKRLKDIHARFHPRS